MNGLISPRRSLAYILPNDEVTPPSGLLPGTHAHGFVIGNEVVLIFAFIDGERQVRPPASDAVHAVRRPPPCAPQESAKDTRHWNRDGDLGA